MRRNSFPQLDYFPGHNISETEMELGSECLTITRTCSVALLRSLTQSERGQVGTQDQTPSSTKTDPPRQFIFIVVGWFEGASTSTDPPRLALFLCVVGHEWR
jgi:hypothetical protein